MPARFATKAGQKQQTCKKLLSLLHKDYGGTLPGFSMPVLETMLFAACLEDNSWDVAERGFDRLQKLYYDLNEIRVSSVAEIEETLNSNWNGDWAGLRIRSILRFVFETTYTYDYEKLKRLTNESAQKRLKKIDHMSPFIRNFTVQQSLAGYLVCLDTLSTRAAIHLGIVPPGSTEEEAGDFLRPGLKKADSFGFMCALRSLATDPRFIDRLSEPPDEDEPFDLTQVEHRFNALKKPKKKKTAAKKTAAKKSSVKAAVAKSTVPTKRTRRKTTTGKKTVRTKVGAVKKAASKASSARKIHIKTTTARSTPAKRKTSVSVAAKRKTTGKHSAASAKKPVVKKVAAQKKAVRKKAAKKQVTGKKR